MAITRQHDGMSEKEASDRGDTPLWRRRRNSTRLLLLGLVCVISLAALGVAWSITEAAVRADQGIACGHNHDSLSERRITQQQGVSFRRILENIGPGVGAKDGLVVASQSRGEGEQPDYYYTWTRDSALTIKTLLAHFLPAGHLFPWSYRPPSEGRGLGNSTTLLLIEPLVRAYISSQGELQLLSTRSGDLHSGGLNEPKYGADGTVYNGDWGRPQRDGPALRALALIPYAQYLLDRGFPLDAAYVRDHLYDPQRLRAQGNVIKNDLEEIARGWWKEGYDLWEEIQGHHLWTRLVSLRALQAGAVLAERLDDPFAAEYYAKSAARIQARLAHFWVDDKRNSGYWASSISGTHRLATMARIGVRGEEIQLRSEEVRVEQDQVRYEEVGGVSKHLDCGFVLSVLHTADLRAWNDTAERGWTSFEASHPGVLATVRQYAKSLHGVYPINRGGWTAGWVLGRYAGDVYDGVGQSNANPWFICTHAFAQVLYLAHQSFLRARLVKLTPHSAPFWSDVLGRHVDAGAWHAGDGQYELALRALWRVAEAYRLRAQGFVPANGSMSEQIHRINGEQRGARDLTWSHASFLDMSRARQSALHDWQ